MNGVTVHMDKHGIIREYMEEQRRACVGELVKYRWTGEVAAVVEIFGGDTLYKLESGAVWSIDNTIVLVPTGVIRRAGKRWREVERVAEVGETVVYEDGRIRVAAIVKPTEIYTDTSAIFRHGTYRVLEPINASTPSPTPSDADRIAALEKRVEELEASITSIRRHTYADGYNQGKFDARAESTHGASLIEQIHPLIADLYKDNTSSTYAREQVVEMAKRDVEELLRTDIVDVPMLNAPTVKVVYHTNGYEDGGRDVVEFIDDRKHGKVIALIRLEKYGEFNRVWARGIAKCETGDCFNISIGRAISLRRALGLDVPSYYTNAPKPTVAQVGDVVRTHVLCRELTLKRRRPDRDYANRRAFEYNTGGWDAEESFTIIDDSHDFGQEAKS